MSKRSISENLNYNIDNEGLTYQTDGNLSLTVTGSATLNSNPITTGTVTSGSNINIGAAPNRVINTITPKMVKFGKTLSVGANTPTLIDWSTGVTVETDTFAIAPILNTNYAGNITIATTNIQCVTRGLWHFMFYVNLTANATVDLLTIAEILKKPDFPTAIQPYGLAMLKRTTGDPAAQSLVVHYIVYMDTATLPADTYVQTRITAGQAITNGIFELTCTLLNVLP